MANTRPGKEIAPENIGRSGGGESGGGNYPNPHDGKKPKEGLNDHGGQTDISYHGGGQLGDESIGKNANAPAKGH